MLATPLRKPQRSFGWVGILVCVLALPVARGQDKSTPPPDQLEPGVDTSAPASAAGPSAAAGDSAAGRSVTAPSTTGPNGSKSRSAANAAAGGPPTRTGTRPKSNASTAASAPAPSNASSATNAPGTPGEAPAAKAGARTGKALDRLQLDETQITGNRELPKVLYIVPWKRSDLGDLVGKPVNSLLDEVLEPVDRDVFKRENRYYEALKPDQAKQGTVTVEGSGDKR